MKGDEVRMIDKRTFSPVHEMRGLRKALLAPVAYPLSLVYAVAVRAWRRRAVEAADIGTPVVSVGSVSVGGTGKTPLTMLLADGLRGRGLRVAIVSRGYKRRRGPSPLLVSDYDGVRADIEEAGDEPYLTAARLAGVPVIVDADRVRGAGFACQAVGPDVILLDDGFQCRRLSKRLDIVTVAADTLAGGGYLPWGPLRESPAAIGPDDFVVVVARSGAERHGAGGGGRRAHRGALPGGRHYRAYYADPVLVGPDGREAAGPPGAERALVVSGIARPEAFEATCAELGVDAGAKIRFDDHHWYDEADRSMIERVMEETGCERLVTTEKDLWRLPAALRGRARAVRISLRVEDPGFMDDVIERIGGDD